MFSKQTNMVSDAVERWGTASMFLAFLLLAMAFNYDFLRAILEHSQMEIIGDQSGMESGTEVQRVDELNVESFSLFIYFADAVADGEIGDPIDLSFDLVRGFKISLALHAAQA